MHIKLTCEYLGTNFHGFQSQVGKPTIQNELEKALSKFFSSDIKIVGSGRTDAGVHAVGQVVSFICPDHEVNLYKMMLAVNAFLPADISVKNAELKEKFNARSEAVAKTYVYKCYIGANRSPLRDKTYHQIYKPLDIDEIRRQAEFLTGLHDFTSFCTELAGKSPVRTIYSLDVKEDGDELWFVIRGTGFLKNMVRIIVGSLLDGRDIKSVINAKDRKAAGMTAPAKGLTLLNVEYKD